MPSLDEHNAKIQLTEAQVTQRLVEFETAHPEEFKKNVAQGKVLEEKYIDLSQQDFGQRVNELAIKKTKDSLLKEEAAELLFAQLYADQNEGFKAEIWNALYGPGGAYYEQGFDVTLFDLTSSRTREILGGVLMVLGALYAGVVAPASPGLAAAGYYALGVTCILVGAYPHMQ